MDLTGGHGRRCATETSLEGAGSGCRRLSLAVVVLLAIAVLYLLSHSITF